MDLDHQIPNNVGLADDKRLQRALLRWQPDFLAWWNERGPAGHAADEVYLRTAVSVEPGGWAHYGYVRMPQYRWGLFLARPEQGRTWQARRADWLPTPQDDAQIRAVSGRVDQPGQKAHWIAPPRRGIDDRPLDFEYVRFH